MTAADWFMLTLTVVIFVLPPLAWLGVLIAFIIDPPKFNLW